MSVQTVVAWESEGLPVADAGAPGREKQYDLPATIAWRVAREAARRDATVEAERRRLVAAQADRAEIGVAQRAGELVELGEFRRGAVQAARELQERILAVADRLAPTLDAHDPGRAQKLLTDEFETILSRLAGYLESLGVGLDPHPPPAPSTGAVSKEVPLAAPRRSSRTWATSWRP